MIDDPDCNGWEESTATWRHHLVCQIFDSGVGELELDLAGAQSVFHTLHLKAHNGGYLTAAQAVEDDVIINSAPRVYVTMLS
jgi:hypothetical protein